MSDKNDVKIEGHDYDGIEELDNNLPAWWINMFYLSIAFAVLYWGYYELAGGPSLNQEYIRTKAELALKEKGAAQAIASEEELQGFVKEPRRLEAGSRIFTERCIACHGDKGQGGIGPNLTDEYWLHGAKLEDVLKTVTNGVMDKGMPAWKTFYKMDDLYSAVAYITFLRGSNPAGAKAPQGDLVK